MGSHTGRSSRSLRHGPRGSLAVHLFGALALLASLFLPLTAQAAPTANDPAALARAQSSEVGPVPEPDQVAVIGDFQLGLGCAGDFDPSCEQSQLTENEGRWSGTFAISPGTYNYQIVATGIDGQQRVYGDGGLDGSPLTVDVGDDQTGVYFAFNPRTDDITAEPVGNLYQLSTDADQQLLVPDGDELTGVVVAPGGDFPYEFVLNGESLGQQSVSLDPGRYRLIFDQEGNLLDSERLPEGTLTITRADGATGACYQLRRDGEVANQACDVDDGDDGSTVMTFPDGLEPGGYTLSETTTPDGAETSTDTDVELVEGDNSVEIPAGGDGGEDGDGDDDETPSIDQVGVDESPDATDESTETSTDEAGGEPGDLIVTLQTEDSQPVGGACFELVGDDDQVVEESCDTAEFGDSNPGNGNTGFFGVPSGTYTLRLSQAPEGIASVDEREVTVEAGGETAEVVTGTAGNAESPEATADATGDATDEATDTATEGTGDFVVLRQDDAGNAVGGACFDIVNDDGTTVAEEVCDEDGDVADDGRIGFSDVPVGSWTLRETRTPTNAEPAAEQQIEIVPDVETDLVVQSALIDAETETGTETETATDTETETETASPEETSTAEATATEEPQPGDLIVTLQSEDGQAIGGACFELLDQNGDIVEESCDTAEFGDANPGNGNTGFFGVPSGTYTLRLSEAPDGVQPPEDQPVEVPAGGDEPGTAIVTVAVEATTETETATETETETETEAVTPNPGDEPGSVVVVGGSFGQDAETPLCVELNTGGGIGLTDPPAACDNGDGDASGDPGIILLNAVPAGEYTLTVTDGPEGATEIEPQTVTVTSGEQTTVNLEAPAPTETLVPTETPQATQTPTPEGPESGTLTIVVENPDGEPLAETCFDVTNEAGTFGFCDEDGDGTLVVEDVAFGEQTVEQTDAPEGFELAAAETVAVTAEQPEAELTVTNEGGAGTLPVVAVDAEGTGLPGACFVLTSTENADTTFGPRCDDGNNGGIASDGFVTFDQVPPGDYTLTEDSPPDGYQQAGETAVTIQSGENEPVRITHEPAPATVRVTTTSSDGATLTSACYTIDGGDEVCDIDGDGILNIEGIAPGEHTLDQTTPPEGFQEAEDTIFAVEAGQSLVEVTVVNQATTGTVAVAVVDEAEEPLGEACATLDGGEEVCDDAANDAFPDESGRIGFAEVTAGEHTVALSEVPDDFEAPAEDETVTVVAEETAEATFTLAGAQPETGTLELTIQRTGDATEVVEGACVTLSSGGDVVEYCDGGQGDTDGAANGVILATDVAAGTYTVELTDASADAIDGFDSAESLNLTITAGGTTVDTLDVTVVIQPTAGVIEVVSRDAGTQELLGGACYELSGDGDPIALCDDGDDDEDGTDGVILRSGIPAGTYTLVQTQTPDTYQAAADVTDVVMTPPGTTTVTVDHQQEEQPGTLVVEKVDGNGQLLAGACFEVRQGNTLVADECEADEGDGVFSFELMAGDYRLRETRPPSDDYRVAGSRIVSVSASEETRVQVVNRPRAGRVEITSVDAADPDSRLENACFELRGERTYGSYCDDDDLTVDGRVLFENVAPGDYTIVETAVPDGFQRVADQTITVGPGGFVKLTIQHEATPPPTEQGRLLVYKQDGQQQELPGGCFRLYDGDSPVSAETCDNDDGVNDATTIIDGAPVGTYTLRETLAPSPAYQIGEPTEVTIENGGTTEITVVNQLKRGRILIRKTNEHGQALQNACFDLAQDDGGERCTDSHGRVSFDNLAPGEYDVTETRAPYGYEAVAPQEGVAVEPGKTTVLDLVDPIAEPDPDTGSVQVQKFVCPAGEQGERTVFFGGNEGNERLKNTAGCRKGNAEFTLTGGDGSGPGGFATGDDGQYQVTLPAGDYNLVETAPDLPGASETGVRVVANKLTTVIVINFIAPPAPAAATINAVKYTCPAGFEGTLYDDFAQGCATNDRLTNHITIRANGPDQARGVTGDDGQRGMTTLEELTPGHYQVFEERPYTIPTAYGFCGYDPENPTDFKTVNGQIAVTLEAGAELTCAFFNIPEELTDTSGTILVRKYVCDVNDPPANYDWYEECRLSDEGARFELNAYVVEGDRYEPYTTGTANADGLLRFPRLQPGTYQLKEIDSNWCHAESNSVNSKGDVVVSANKISDVFIFNCVDTKNPPNTGAGPNAGPVGGELPGADRIVPSLAWPVALLAAWGWHRRRTRWVDAA